MEFFRRFLDEVCEADGDLSRWHTPIYRRIFYEELPLAMNALADDPSPEAQVRASVTYNLIVEGVLAETGYHSYALALERNEEGVTPFGITLDEIMVFASSQFEKRIDRVRRGAAHEEVEV